MPKRNGGFAIESGSDVAKGATDRMFRWVLSSQIQAKTPCRRGAARNPGVRRARKSPQPGIGVVDCRQLGGLT